MNEESKVGDSPARKPWTRKAICDYICTGEKRLPVKGEWYLKPGKGPQPSMIVQAAYHDVRALTLASSLGYLTGVLIYKAQERSAQ